MELINAEIPSQIPTFSPADIVCDKPLPDLIFGVMATYNILTM